MADPKRHVWVIECTSRKGGGWYECWFEHRTTKKDARELLDALGWRQRGMFNDDGSLVRYRVTKYMPADGGNG